MFIFRFFSTVQAGVAPESDVVESITQNYNGREKFLSDPETELDPSLELHLREKKWLRKYLHFKDNINLCSSCKRRQGQHPQR